MRMWALNSSVQLEYPHEDMRVKQPEGLLRGIWNTQHLLRLQMLLLMKEILHCGHESAPSRKSARGKEVLGFQTRTHQLLAVMPEKDGRKEKSYSTF